MTFSRRIGVFLLLVLFSSIIVMSPSKADPQFLEPQQAFQFSAEHTSTDMLTVTYVIAEGYYMYRERFKFDAVGATLGAPIFPPGAVHFDTTFDKNVETYRHAVTVRIPVRASGDFTLIAHAQGCSEKGLCYAPMESKKDFDGRITAAVLGVTGSAGQGSGDSLSDSLKSGRLLIIMPLFLLLGLGLAFTPCVLPMVPILSSIIVGEGVGISRRRGVMLSLSYSFGMALVYTSLGIAAGLLGEGLAASLQNPWVLMAFALLMVVLSLSMFGYYQLQVPSWLQNKLARASDTQRPGKLLGVFVMGAISALIVGPCVAAPLASALVYISQTHNVIVGGSALFAMAMGMSLPLLLVGLSAGALLPKAGRWMESIKQLFGVLMLAMALWLVSPVLAGWLQMLMWSILLVGYGVVLLRHNPLLVKAVALCLLATGAIQLLGSVTGATDPFAPLAHVIGSPVKATSFVRINSIKTLDQALATARLNNKPVMLDFYADWCVSCKEMEKLTFSNARVKPKLDSMVLLQADVTANTDDDKALLKRFGLFGPPGMIFFNVKGKESGRIIGFQPADLFVTSVSTFNGPS